MTETELETKNSAYQKGVKDFKSVLREEINKLYDYAYQHLDDSYLSGFTAALNKLENSIDLITTKK